MKFIFFLILPLFLFSQGTYKNVFFTDDEENLTLLFLNNTDYTDLKSIINKNTLTKNIILKRKNLGLYSSLSQFVSNNSVNTLDMFNLRTVAPNKMTNDYVYRFGLTFFQFNFLMSIIGAFIGFMFLYLTIFFVKV